MKLDGTFLRSKVARRVLLLFVLAAFIPFLVISFLYFAESNQALVRESHVRLQATSASFGTTIYDRLLLAEQLLHSAADDLKSDSAPSVVQERLGKAFRSLSLVSSQGGVVPVFGDLVDLTPLDEAATARLRQGRSVLTARKTSSHRGRVLELTAFLCQLH